MENICTVSLQWWYIYSISDYINWWVYCIYIFTSKICLLLLICAIRIISQENYIYQQTFHILKFPHFIRFILLFSFSLVLCVSFVKLVPSRPRWYLWQFLQLWAATEVSWWGQRVCVYLKHWQHGCNSRYQYPWVQWSL